MSTLPLLYFLIFKETCKVLSLTAFRSLLKCYLLCESHSKHPILSRTPTLLTQLLDFLFFCVTLLPFDIYRYIFAYLSYYIILYIIEYKPHRTEVLLFYLKYDQKKYIILHVPMHCRAMLHVQARISLSKQTLCNILPP